ncbi:LAETG motif-containing sortase-dependent surface protein [Streptomyces sp. bgisy159]
MLGVTAASAALVFGTAGGAFAGNIKDFSAAASCVGDKGVITVTDKNPAGTPAVVTVFLENNGADLRKVGELEVEGTKQGATVTFEEDWEPGAVYRIHVTAGNQVDEDVSPNLTAPAEACKTKDEPKPPATPTGSPSPSASASKSASAPSRNQSASTPTAPAPSTATPPRSDTASNAPSPAGESNLAETGAGSSTGLIVAVAAVLVAVGGAAVFFGLRRRGTGR